MEIILPVSSAGMLTVFRIRRDERHLHRPFRYQRSHYHRRDEVPDQRRIQLLREDRSNEVLMPRIRDIQRNRTVDSSDTLDGGVAVGLLVQLDEGEAFVRHDVLKAGVLDDVAVELPTESSYVDVGLVVLQDGDQAIANLENRMYRLSLHPFLRRSSED